MQQSHELLGVVIEQNYQLPDNTGSITIHSSTKQSFTFRYFSLTNLVGKRVKALVKGSNIISIEETITPHEQRMKMLESAGCLKEELRDWVWCAVTRSFVKKL
jgi:hypothetical protein